MTTVSGRFLPGWDDMERQLAKGLLAVMLYAEAQAKARFQDVGGPLPRPPSAPGEGPVVQTGNDRRSIHSVVFYKGQALGGSNVDGNGNTIPSYDPGDGLVGYMGTNCGYGGFLELGTAIMAARPAIIPGALDALGRVDELIAAGAKR